MQVATRVDRIVVMGVSGCGKSTLAHAIAEHLGWQMVEGDTLHSAGNVEKMTQGIALTDADRQDWLNQLADVLSHAVAPTVVTCSALKKKYRDILREAAPDHVGFVYMALTQDESFNRVKNRRGHMFPASLVADQFATLQSPEGELNVLTVQGTDSTQTQLAAVENWLDVAPAKRAPAEHTPSEGT